MAPVTTASTRLITAANATKLLATNATQVRLNSTSTIRRPSDGKRSAATARSAAAQAAPVRFANAPTGGLFHSASVAAGSVWLSTPTATPSTPRNAVFEAANTHRRARVVPVGVHKIQTSTS